MLNEFVRVMVRSIIEPGMLVVMGCTTSSAHLEAIPSRGGYDGLQSPSPAWNWSSQRLQDDIGQIGPVLAKGHLTTYAFRSLTQWHSAVKGDCIYSRIRNRLQSWILYYFIFSPTFIQHTRITMVRWTLPLYLGYIRLLTAVTSIPGLRKTHRAKNMRGTWTSSNLNSTHMLIFTIVLYKLCTVATFKHLGSL
jgi:hypothetical protein